MTLLFLIFCFLTKALRFTVLRGLPAWFPLNSVGGRWCVAETQKAIITANSSVAVMYCTLILTEEAIVQQLPNNLTDTDQLIDFQKHAQNPVVLSVCVNQIKC